jgi:uncharacterized protein
VIAPKLLVSLHDVSPRHALSVEAILSEFVSLGLPLAVLLVVPDFHGRWPLTDNPEFTKRLREWSGLGHELALHGFFHLEQPQDQATSRGAAAFLRRQFMTAGEGEFLSMDPDRQRAMLERGLAMWAGCGLERPVGFVPPAWLHRPDLPSTLWDMGFSWTENHAGLAYRSRPFLRSPVITWASRDAVRRIGSLAFAPLALRAWRNEPVLRVAIHPHDWDHPSLVRSIRSTLRRAARMRTPISSPLQA